MLEVRRVFPMISDNGLLCSEPFKQYVEFMTRKGPPQMAWIVSRERTGHRLLHAAMGLSSQRCSVQ